VADFRDEWAANPHRTHDPRALARLAAKAERAITFRAARVVVAADYFQLDGLAADDPQRIVILNGVDGSDVRTESARPSTDRFVLAHVGTLYDSIDPSPVLRTLASLIERQEIEAERVGVRFVGSMWLDHFQCPPELPFERVGYVEHAQAVTEMVSATALLLYVPESSLAPSGKLFEYLASGRPVLCLTHPDNLASRLVREWHAGVVANPHDEEAIAQAILTLWRRWQEDGLPDQPAVRRRALERYSRQAGAERLANVLEEAARG
jgi:glycosyltransferase involved in cell wall biosynthesis